MRFSTGDNFEVTLEMYPRSTCGCLTPIHNKTLRPGKTRPVEIAHCVDIHPFTLYQVFFVWQRNFESRRNIDGDIKAVMDL